MSPDSSALHLLTDSAGEITLARAHWLSTRGPKTIPLRLGRNITQWIDLVDFVGNLSVELAIPIAPLDEAFFLFHAL